MANQPRGRKTQTLMVRLDPKSKRVVRRAAALRRVSASDYVRSIVVPQAQREVDAPAYAWALTKEEQLAFWTALQEPPITPGLRRLGRLMGGE